MARHILKCKCGRYTMDETCPECGEKAFSPKPPKYSPDDPYAEYRRKAKMKEFEEKGLV